MASNQSIISAEIKLSEEVKFPKDQGLSLGADTGKELIERKRNTELQLTSNAGLETKLSSEIHLCSHPKSTIEIRIEQEKWKEAQVDGKLLVERKVAQDVNCLSYNLRNQNLETLSCCNKRFKIEESFKAVNAILKLNPQIKKFIFIENNFPYENQVNDNNKMPLDWEEQFFDLLKGTGIKNIKFVNMLPIKRIIGLFREDLKYKNSIKDITFFIQKLYNSGIRELDLGNIIIYRSLPSALKAEELESFLATFKTCTPCSCFCWTLFPYALPFAMCFCLGLNPNCCSEPFIDETVNEQEWKELLEADLEFISLLALNLKNFSVLSIDMKNLVKFMARVQIRRPMDEISINEHRQHIDLTEFAKTLVGAKFKILNIKNLELAYATPQSRLQTVKTLFSMDNLQILSVVNCNIFNPLTSLEESKEIALAIASSNLRILTGLGLNNTSTDNFKAFLEIILAETKNLDIIDLSDIEKYDPEQRLTYEAGKGCFDLVVNSRTVKLIGVKCLNLEFKKAFFEVLISNFKESLDQKNENMNVLDLSGLCRSEMRDEVHEMNRASFKIEIGDKKIIIIVSNAMEISIIMTIFESLLREFKEMQKLVITRLNLFLCVEAYPLSEFDKLGNMLHQTNICRLNLFNDMDENTKSLVKRIDLQVILERIYKFIMPLKNNTKIIGLNDFANLYQKLSAGNSKPVSLEVTSQFIELIDMCQTLIGTNRALIITNTLAELDLQPKQARPMVLRYMNFCKGGKIGDSRPEEACVFWNLEFRDQIEDDLDASVKKDLKSQKDNPDQKNKSESENNDSKSQKDIPDQSDESESENDDSKSEHTESKAEPGLEEEEQDQEQEQLIVFHDNPEAYEQTRNLRL